MTVHDAQVVHFLPGRLRLKSAHVKDNPTLAQEVQQTLTTLPGVLDVTAQPATGSVLILYDPAHACTLSRIADMCGWPQNGTNREQIEDWLQQAIHTSPHLATDLRQMFGGVNDGAAYATGGWADLRTLVPVALLFLGVRSFIVTRPLPVPQWYDFFWFAFGIFMALNPPARPQSTDTTSLEMSIS